MPPVEVAKVAIFVCTTCKSSEQPDCRPGLDLLRSIKALLEARPEGGVEAIPVACLSVCKRPCTIAFTATQKWTYVIGDLTAQSNAEEIVDMAFQYQRTHDGVVPWRQRPQSVRKGVVSRTPPIDFRPESQRASDEPDQS